MKKKLYIKSITPEYVEYPIVDFMLQVDGSRTSFGDVFDIVEAYKNDRLYVCTEDIFQDFSNSNYSELKRVLEMAYKQAAEGKGKERHANGEKFEDQPIMTIAKGHGLGYQTGQAAKKLQEAHTLLKLRGKHAAIQEILGAINYAAAAVLLIEQMEDEGEKK